MGILETDSGAEEYRPFLDAIRATPDDDTLRLVAADWLEEHGYPRSGEFVRVQVELAQMTESQEERADAFDSRFAQLVDRERALWTASLGDGGLQLVWGADVLGATGSLTRELQLNDLTRGFLEYLFLSSPCFIEWWVRYGDHLLTRHPIREVNCSALPSIIVYGPGAESSLGRPATRTETATEGAMLEWDPNRRIFPTAAILAELRDEEPVEAAVLRLRWPQIGFLLPPAPGA